MGKVRLRDCQTGGQQSVPPPSRSQLGQLQKTGFADISVPVDLSEVSTSNPAGSSKDVHVQRQVSHLKTVDFQNEQVNPKMRATYAFNQMVRHSYMLT